MTIDSIIQCPYCNSNICTDSQVKDMERLKKDIQETHCNNCGMVITVVMTIVGVRCLEVLINEKKQTELSCE